MRRLAARRVNEANEKARLWRERRDAGIRERFKAGETKSSIARDYGLTRQRVQQILAGYARCR